MEKQCVFHEKDVVFLNIISMDFMLRSVQYAVCSLFCSSNIGTVVHTLCISALKDVLLVLITEKEIPKTGDWVAISK